MNWTIFTSIFTILILIIDLSNSEKLCDSVDIQEIAEWANNLPALKAQDEERGCVGKWQDEIESKYYTFFDIVLMKK